MTPSSPTVVFNRTVRVCKRGSDEAMQEIPLSLAVKYSGVLDKAIFYKLPGFGDAAQVRRLTVDVVNGGGEIQLKVFKTKSCDIKKILRILRIAGWQ